MAPQKRTNLGVTEKQGPSGSTAGQPNKLKQVNKNKKPKQHNLKANKIVNQYFYGASPKSKKAKTKNIGVNTTKLDPTKAEKCMNTDESSFDYVKLDPVDYLHNRVIQQNHHNYWNWHSNTSKLCEFMYHFTYEINPKSDLKLYKQAITKLQKTFNSPEKFFKSKRETVRLLKNHMYGQGYLYECYEYSVLSFYIDLKNKDRRINFGKIHESPLVVDFLDKFFSISLGSKLGIFLLV